MIERMLAMVAFVAAMTHRRSGVAIISLQRDSVRQSIHVSAGCFFMYSFAQCKQSAAVR
jgi:hypothetical protein